MNQVKRYGTHLGIHVGELDGGIYVLYSDYEKLQAELKTVILIGVESQREVNRKLSEKNAEMQKFIKKVADYDEEYSCENEIVDIICAPRLARECLEKVGLE